MNHYKISHTIKCLFYMSTNHGKMSLLFDYIPSISLRNFYTFYLSMSSKTEPWSVGNWAAQAVDEWMKLHLHKQQVGGHVCAKARLPTTCAKPFPLPPAATVAATHHQQSTEPERVGDHCSKIHLEASFIDLLEFINTIHLYERSKTRNQVCR